METFPFPFFTYSTKHNSDGAVLKLGRGYNYASKPVGPSVKLITLVFESMKYFGRDGVPNLTQEPKVNMALLEAFYLRHELWADFILPHPVYGDLRVKFNKPLEIPEGIKKGGGALKGFSLEMMEQP